MQDSYKQKQNADSAPLFENVAIIGCGLIGSSIARAAKRYGVCSEIGIFDLDEDVCKKCQELELGKVGASLADTVSHADLIFLCIPVGAYGSAIRDMLPHLKEGAIVSDVGSIKHAIALEFKDVFSDSVHFIPGHPIAGTEHSGPASGFAELFQDAWHLLCPYDDTDPLALSKLTQFWQELGARVETMDSATHDRVLAVTSHIPHLIAFNIVGTAADMESVDTGEVVKYSASGFRDFTRIAGSDPVMWRDVFLNNKEAILEVLGRFTEDLIAMQRAIRWDDAAFLEDKIKRARGIRKDILGKGPGDYTPPE